VGGRSTAAKLCDRAADRAADAQRPRAADVHIHQVVDYPEINLTVNRSKAGQVGLTQRDVSTSLLISLSSSGQIAPTQWLDWRSGVSYNVALQTRSIASIRSNRFCARRWAPRREW